VPENDVFALPSDFNGLGALEYEVRDDRNYEAAVSRACSQIKKTNCRINVL
jgi:hypothetical protein